MTKFNFISIAQEVLEIEAAEIKNVSSQFNNSFNELVSAILETKGRVVLCGMGKSGHIAQKIAATLVSTGTPSLFLHPAEAYHGDLGMIVEGDIFLGISNSGETVELINLYPFIKDNGNIFAMITGHADSTLARLSNIHVTVAVSKEACPLELAPTASTTAVLAVGDAIAVCLMKARNFEAKNFARFHPGGSLGRRLLSKVRDHVSEISTVQSTADGRIILERLAKSKVGLVCVTDQDKLVGIITVGDFTRALTSRTTVDLERVIAEEIMNRKPITIACDQLCGEADDLMKVSNINSVVAMDEEKPLGVYHNLNGVEK